jgi:FlaA1/EpsC-like NDP-sugar epimerase
MFKILQKYIKNDIAYLPKFMILFIDILIVAFVLLLSYFSLTLLNINFLDVLDFEFRLLLNVIFYFFYFLIFKTYKGIVRFSTIKDVVSIFNSVAFTFVSLLIINFSYYFFKQEFIFLNTILFINGLFVFFSLVLFRIVVRILFQKLSAKPQLKYDELVIIGVNSTTIALAEGILSDLERNFKIRFFIDTNKLLHDKKILEISIVSKYVSIMSVLRLYKIKHVVLSKNFLDEIQEAELLDYCLKHQIQVYNPTLLAGVGDYEDLPKIKKYTINDLLFRNSIEIKNSKVNEEFKNKTILVTGAAGSIGSEIVLQLIQLQPKAIVIVDQAESPLHELELQIKFKYPKAVCYFHLTNVTNKEEMNFVFSTYKPDIVFHAAAYKHVPLLENNFYQAIKVNVFGTKNVLDQAIKNKVSRFVFISTDKAVNPTNIMGASKRIAEIMVQARFFKHKKENKKFITDVITSRFGNVLGSNGSVVNLFEKQIDEGGPITVTHPEITRYFMTIPEACRLVLEAATMGNGGEIYVFDMGKPIKILDLAEKMIRLNNKIPHKDIKIVYTGLRPGEKLYEELLADTTKTLPTYNPKILIAKEKVYSFDEVDVFLEELIQMRDETNKQVFIKKITNIVPEFVHKANNI